MLFFACHQTGSASTIWEMDIVKHMVSEGKPQKCIACTYLIPCCMCPRCVCCLVIYPGKLTESYSVYISVVKETIIARQLPRFIHSETTTCIMLKSVAPAISLECKRLFPENQDATINKLLKLHDKSLTKGYKGYMFTHNFYLKLKTYSVIGRSNLVSKCEGRLIKRVLELANPIRTYGKMSRPVIANLCQLSSSIPHRYQTLTDAERSQPLVTRSYGNVSFGMLEEANEHIRMVQNSFSLITKQKNFLCSSTNNCSNSKVRPITNKQVKWVEECVLCFSAIHAWLKQAGSPVEEYVRYFMAAHAGMKKCILLGDEYGRCFVAVYTGFKIGVCMIDKYARCSATVHTGLKNIQTDSNNCEVSKPCNVDGNYPATLRPSPNNINVWELDIIHLLINLTTTHSNDSDSGTTYIMFSCCWLGKHIILSYFTPSRSLSTMPANRRNRDPRVRAFDPVHEAITPTSNPTWERQASAMPRRKQSSSFKI